MKNKVIKILSFIIIFFIISTIFSNISNAISNILSGAENFISSGASENGVTIDTNKLKENSDMIYNILLTVGIIAAFAVGAYLGIKFMTSSIEGKADIKQALIPYIVGCIVVFGAFAIWKIVVNLASRSTIISF